MSISIGIYDFFSYTVPGLIYLLVVYGALNLFHLIKVDIVELGAPLLWGSLIFIVVLAYLVGHIFDTISHLVWYRVFYRGGTEERAYKKFSKTKKGIKASFNSEKWEILLGAIRHSNGEIADAIDKNKAISIMLRNVSFALFLLGVVVFVQIFVSVSVWYLFATLSAIVFIGSGVSLRRSDHFNMAFYHMIYVQSLMYGDSLDKVIEANRKTINGEKARKAKPPKRPSKSKRG